MTLNFPHLYSMSKPHYKPLKKRPHGCCLYLSLILLESLKRLGNYYELSMLYLSFWECHIHAIESEWSPLEIYPVRFWNWFESISMIFDDSVRMVFELCIDLLISYLWDDLRLLKVVHILSVWHELNWIIAWGQASFSMGWFDVTCFVQFYLGLFSLFLSRK